jgi:hypothetical protein
MFNVLRCLHANDVPIAANIDPNILYCGKTTLLFPVNPTEYVQERCRSRQAKYRLKWLIPQDLVRCTDPTKA